MRITAKLPLILTIGGLLALPACSGSAPDKGEGANVAANHAAPAPANAATANVALPGPGPQSVVSKADGLEFTYRWPAEASAVPELDTWLRGNAEKLRKENQAGAAEAQADAKKSDYPFNGYSYEEKYAVVGDTPHFLVLLSDGYVFTGGAHGMPFYTAILWEKATKRRLGTGALIDVPRLASVTKARFCAALDKQRAEKRGEPVRHDDPDELDDFVQCPNMTEQLIVPISKGGKALDTIRVVIGPYTAGPYAEGSYVIDMAVDKAILGTVKSAHRDAFATAG